MRMRIIPPAVQRIIFFRCFCAFFSSQKKPLHTKPSPKTRATKAIVPKERVQNESTQNNKNEIITFNNSCSRQKSQKYFQSSIRSTTFSRTVKYCSSLIRNSKRRKQISTKYSENKEAKKWHKNPSHHLCLKSVVFFSLYYTQNIFFLQRFEKKHLVLPSYENSSQHSPLFCLSDIVHLLGSTKIFWSLIIFFLLLGAGGIFSLSPHFLKTKISMFDVPGESMLLFVFFGTSYSH